MDQHARIRGTDSEHHGDLRLRIAETFQLDGRTLLGRQFGQSGRHGVRKLGVHDSFIGRFPDRLSIADRKSLSGKWYATEIYNTVDLPLRRIEALGGSPADCAMQLKRRGLDPRKFEFQIVTPSF